MVVPLSFLCGGVCGGLCSVGEGWRLFHVNPVWKQSLSAQSSLGFGVGAISLAEPGQRR